MNIFKRFKDQAQAFRVSLMAGKLRELVELKKRQTPKKLPRNKKAYQWGTLGLSQVSADMKKDYGRIVSRRERKALVKQGVQMVKYYNS